MQKHSFFTIAMLIVVFASCNKTSTYKPQQFSGGIGGWSIDGITGYSNILLTKNTDTTIKMPITVGTTVDGNWQVGITISFSYLPSVDVVSVTPISYEGVATTFNAFVTDTFAFHIHAIDTGIFPVAVIADDGVGSPTPKSDTFKIIVH